MAYDPLLDCVVLFGGRANSNAPLGDTWEFGNGHWTNITSKLTRAPSPRYEPAVAYDPDMRAIVLFGGDGSNGWLSDTWVFNGSWSKETISPSPSDRSDAALAYDAKDAYLLLFGGARSGSRLSDTWSLTRGAFGSGVWTNLSPSLSFGPPPAQLMATYDATDGVVWLEGGRQGQSCFEPGVNLTWQFSEGGWTNLTGRLRDGPPINEGTTTLSYDADAQAVVVFSGKEGPSCTSNDQTWEYVNQSWANLTAMVGRPPPGEWEGRLTYVPPLHGDLLFGGNLYVTGGANDFQNYTWLFTPSAEALNLTVVVRPQVLCEGSSTGCSAPATTRVTLTLRAVAARGVSAFGEDNGTGWIAYRPPHGVMTPTIAYSSWGSIVPSNPLNASARCGTADGTLALCPSVAEKLPSRTTATAWQWSWHRSDGTTLFDIGAWWSVNFSVQSDGPPAGWVPVDRCATAECAAHGEAAIGPQWTMAGFTSYSGGPTYGDSFPLALVYVEIPPSDSAPQAAPPGPAPPPLPGPQPVGVPTPTSGLPVATPNPVATASTLPSIYLPGVAGGVMAAGFTRGLIGAGRLRVAIALRRGGRGGVTRPPRGYD